jgi:hypothetical protein
VFEAFDAAYVIPFVTRERERAARLMTGRRRSSAPVRRPSKGLPACAPGLR